MNHSLDIDEKISEVNQRISRALLKSRDPSRLRAEAHFGSQAREVKLIAVSKTFPAEAISAAIDAGLIRFGENRVHEIVSKYQLLKDRNPEWHFVGHLQTNKVKKLLDVPTKCIQSVDRLDLAVELDRQLQRRGESRDVLIEVNTSCELSKSGVPPEKATELVRDVARFDTIRVKGLMTIGALTQNAEIIRSCFVLLREIFWKIREEAINKVEMLEMSMGMSGDFEIAVEEGATMIRLGTAIFGERKNTT